MKRLAFIALLAGFILPTVQAELAPEWWAKSDLQRSRQVYQAILAGNPDAGAMWDVLDEQERGEQEFLRFFQETLEGEDTVAAAQAATQVLAFTSIRPEAKNQVIKVLADVFNTPGFGRLAATLMAAQDPVMIDMVGAWLMTRTAEHIGDGWAWPDKFETVKKGLMPLQATLSSPAAGPLVTAMIKATKFKGSSAEEALFRGASVLLLCMLDGLKDNPAAPALMAFVKSQVKGPDKDLRAAFIPALAAWKTDIGRQWVFDMLKDTSGKVRLAAMQQVAESGDGESRKALLSMLKHKDVDTRRNAVYHVAGLNLKAAVPTLEVLLDDPSPEIRLAAVQGLGQMNSRSSAGKIAARLALEKSGYIQEKFIWTLKRFQSASAIKPLAALLATSPEPDVKVAAASALFGIGPAAVPAMIPLLDSKHGLTQQLAATFLKFVKGGAQLTSAQRALVKKNAVSISLLNP